LGFSGIGGFGGGLGMMAALGGFGGLGMPFHMMQLTQRSVPCVYDINDNRFTDYFYQICREVHNEPPVFFNGVPVWFEIPEDYVPLRRVADDYSANTELDYSRDRRRNNDYNGQRSNGQRNNERRGGNNMNQF
jgi:hypothetical protein